jgi:GntR family transcriptional regulator / MocR family aminotransferase
MPTSEKWITQALLTLPEGSEPKYIRLYQRIRGLILDGRFAPGTALPSSRTMAKDLGISRNTALLAVEHLVADGWVEARQGSGVLIAPELPFGAAPASSAAAHRRTDQLRSAPRLFEIGQGAVDLFPTEQWKKIQAKVWNDLDPAALYEPDPFGDWGLREVIAKVVCAARGISCEPEDVLITSSAQSALEIVADVLKGPGSVVVEDPGYPRIRDAFRNRLNIVAQPIDAFGLDVVSAAADNPSLRAAYVTPSVQFPTCITMASDRRLALLNWSNGGGWVIEDDFDGMASFEETLPAPPVRASRNGQNVIYITTFNRVLFPALRIAFVVAPTALHERFAASARHAGEPANLPNQRVLSAFIDTGYYTAHLRRSRITHAQRRERLLAVLEPFLGRLFEPVVNQVGLHLVLRPLRHRDGEIVAALRNAGVAAISLAELAMGPIEQHGVLLGFAAFEPSRIDEKAEALVDALSSLC